MHSHSWSLVVTRGHSWSTRGHSWSLVVNSWSLVVTRGHSWSFVVTRGHSWSLVCTFRHDRIFAGRQSICGLEIQFSTKLGIQTPHYEIVWLKILKNKRPKTEKSLNMPSTRFFDSPIQITFTEYVTAMKFEIRRQGPRNFFRAQTNCPINCQTIDRHMIVPYLKAMSVQSTIFVENTKRK